MGQAGRRQSDGTMNTREAASVHSGTRDSGKGTGRTSVDEGQTEVAGICRTEVNVGMESGGAGDGAWYNGG